jgi:hypothetical protein
MARRVCPLHQLTHGKKTGKIEALGSCLDQDIAQGRCLHRTRQHRKARLVGDRLTERGILRAAPDHVDDTH